MSSFRSTIEFGTSKITCLIDSKRIKGMDLPGSSCVRYEGIRNGKWQNLTEIPKALEQAIETAEKKCSRQIHDAVIGIPADFLKVQTGEGAMEVRTGTLTEDTLRYFAKSIKPVVENGFQLIDVHPVFFLDDKENLYIDLPIGIHTHKIKGMFSYTFAKKSFVKDVTAMLEALHISPQAFIAEPYAEAMHFISEKDRLKTALLVDVGYYSTSVSAVYHNAILASKTIPIGGADFVEDLSYYLQAGPMVSESLKRGHVFGISVSKGAMVYGRNQEGRMESFDQLQVKDIMENRLELLSEAIEKIIYAMRKRQFLSKYAPVYISGAGLVQRGADHFLQLKLGRRVEQVYKKQSSSMAPIYNTAVSLLDNNIDTVYDLCGEAFNAKQRQKTIKLFK